MVNTLQSLGEHSNHRVIFDLQHFAEEASAAVVPQQDAPQPASFEEAGAMYMKAVESDTTDVRATEAVAPTTQEQNAAPEEQKVAEEPAPQQPKDVIELFKSRGVTKFKDPEKVVDSFLSQEKWATRLSQENASLKKQLESMKTPPAEANKQAPETPAEPLDADAFISKLYENPEEALAPIKEQWRQELLRELEPSLSMAQRVAEEGRQASIKNAQMSAAQEFFSENEDAVGLIDKMSEILTEDPSFSELDDPIAIKDLMNKTYTYVRGMSYTPPPKPEDVLQQMLADEGLFNKYIASNPEIKNRLLSTAVADMKRTPAPPAVSAPGGAILTPSPGDAPETFEALGDSIKRSLGYS